MPFNINPIPPGDRSKTHVAAHLELYKESLDTIRVHNPSDEDFTVYWDRMQSNEQYVIPNKNRDIGMGKGNADVPRYVANSYIDRMGSKMIQAISKEDWDKQKQNYRREEQGVYEERLAIRINDPKQWDKVLPQLWVGVVKRYQMNEPEPAPEQQKNVANVSRSQAALERLGINDMEIGIIEDAKNDFINQIQ